MFRTANNTVNASRSQELELQIDDDENFGEEEKEEVSPIEKVFAIIKWLFVKCSYRILIY